jgi:hypothetical protein
MAWQTVETIDQHRGVDRAAAQAVRSAAQPRATFGMVDGRAEPLATASLIADGATLALLTAAHVFEHGATGDLAVPLPMAPGPACDLHGHGSSPIGPGHRAGHHRNAAVANRLRANWTPVESSHLHFSPVMTARRICTSWRLSGLAGPPLRRLDLHDPVVLFHHGSR